MVNVARLPAPVADRWEWQVRAACRGLDPSMFFHPDDERGYAKRCREARAKRICTACPVRRECLEWALAIREPAGIWGGLTVAERDGLIER
jgi:WhiB family transcriptional regulator, redox-sensing transcriptional regulator